MTSKHRQAALRQRMKEEGKERLEIWVYSRHKPLLKRICEVATGNPRGLTKKLADSVCEEIEK